MQTAVPVRVILSSTWLSSLRKHRTCHAFYLQPWKKYFGKVWYLNRLVGLNKLRSVVRGMCHAAGLPRHYTNHSLHSTAATKLYQNNVDKQIIMEITGHQSMAVRSYKRTSERQRKQASKCLFKEPWMHYVAPPVRPLLLYFATVNRSLRPLWWHLWLLYCYVLLSSILLIEPWPWLPICLSYFSVRCSENYTTRKTKGSRPWVV